MTDARGSFARAFVAVVIAWLVASALVPPFRWWIEAAPGGAGPLGDRAFQFWFWPFWSVMAALWSAIPMLLLGTPTVMVLMRKVRQPALAMLAGALIGAGLLYLGQGFGATWRAGGPAVGGLYGAVAGLLGAGFARA